MSDENKNKKPEKNKKIYPGLDDKLTNDKIKKEIDNQEIPNIPPKIRPVVHMGPRGGYVEMEPVGPTEEPSVYNNLPKEKAPEFPKVDGNQTINSVQKPDQQTVTASELGELDINNSVPKDPKEIVEAFKELMGKEDFDKLLENTNLDSPSFKESIENFFNVNFPENELKINIDELIKAFKDEKESIEQNFELPDLEGYDDGHNFN